MKPAISIIIILLIISLSTRAEISTDGTLGQALNLQGPHFQITPNLGQEHGGNLFHSFQDFNLNSEQTATFSGPNNVSNVISRVTGGNPSHIDGLIRSTMPNADMYFMNPYGMMFGPNARLNVQGSFHATTADYLQLGEGGRFDARHPSESLLTVAPVESFGFLMDKPAPIDFQGSQLQVVSEKELTIVGGDIMMEQARFLAGDGEMIGGKIKMASVASQGEVILLESDLRVSSFEDLGNISISGKGHIEGNDVLSVSGERSGLLLIRGKNMLLSNRGFISANTTGNTDATGPGEGINIKLSGQLKLIQGYEIFSKTVASGQSAPVMIAVDRLELKEGSQISSNVWGSGEGNQLTIKANEILLSGISEMKITNSVGTITRNASGFYSVSNSSKLNGVESTINVEAKHLVIENQAQINVASMGIGNAGSINLKVENLEMRQGGAVISSALGLGDGGTIQIEADKIILSEVGTINSSGFGPSEGGNIIIEAKTLELINGGNVNISTVGLGKSGVINIKVSDTLRLSGQADESQFVHFYDFANEQTGGLLPIVAVKPVDLIGPSKISAAVINLGPESAGSIDVEAGQIELTNSAKITAEHRGIGDAGDITIRASDIYLTQGTITTETFGGGGGGNITLNTANLLYLRKGEMTTSVGTGKGQGGEIMIENPTFVVLEQGKIKAQADEGRGGNIRIAAEQFIQSPKSLISASSKLGLDGQVQIHSPAIDLDAMLVVLPGGYVEAQLKQCTQKEIENPNRFKIKLNRSSPIPFGKP